MTIQEYVQQFYDNRQDWFVQECSSTYHQQRILNIINNKEYLSGKHKILQRQSEQYNGKVYEPRKIVLQYAKTILNFATSYLLQHPVTLTGNATVVDEFKKIYNKGNYHNLDYHILDNITKYGNAYEYVYIDTDGTIKSKLIAPEDSYPVYDYENNYIAFIEYYNVILNNINKFKNDFVSFYNVYYPDHVEKWSNVNGQLQLVNSYVNLSGLPIVYKNKNELDPNFGRSDLEDIVSILDNMEDLLSKFADSFYKHHNPIPVVIGQQLKGEGLPTSVVGGGIVLDDGADFKMVSNQLDSKGFETIYKTLKQALLDVSSTPAVSLNSQDVSNLSEVSIKLLFSLADVKAGMNEQFMREGFMQRFEKIRVLLKYQGITFTDDDFNTLNVVFQYARPQNEKDIIENLKTLREIGGISVETMLEKSPYTNDVGQEIQRLSGEKQ